MKLSTLNQVAILASERRRLVAVLSDIEDGETVQATVCGWDVDVPDDIAEQLTDRVAKAAAADLDRVEAEISALGVEIDIPRSVYRRGHGSGPECDCYDCQEARTEMMGGDQEQAA